MKKCSKCNTEFDDKATFCSNCGIKLKKVRKTTKKSDEEKEDKNGKDFFNKIGNNIEKILDTEDTSKEYTDEDIDSYRGLAVLAYIGPLALIPYFKGKDHKYAYYHAVQGMNLLLIWVLYTVFAIAFYQIKVNKSCSYIFGKVISKCETVTPWWIRLPFGIIGFSLIVLSIIGIIYALLGKAKKLPLVDKVNIIK